MTRWLRSLFVELLHLGWALFLGLGVGVVIELGVGALAVGVALASPRMGVGGVVLVGVLGLVPALLLGLLVSAAWMTVVPRRRERAAFVDTATRLGLTPSVAREWYTAEGRVAGRAVRIQVAPEAPGGGHLPGGLTVSVDADLRTYATVSPGPAGLRTDGADTAWLADWTARPGVAAAGDTLFGDLVTGSTLSLSPRRLVLSTGVGGLPALEGRVRALVTLADAAERAPRPTIEGATTLGRLTESLSGHSRSGLTTLSTFARVFALFTVGGIALTWLGLLVSGTLAMLAA